MGQYQYLLDVKNWSNPDNLKKNHNEYNWLDAITSAPRQLYTV